MLATDANNPTVRGDGADGHATHNGSTSRALVPLSPSPLIFPGMDWGDGGSTVPPAVAGGPDLTAILHCLRRRWFLATTLGMVLGLILAGAAYFLVPVKTPVEAFVLISREQQHIVGNESRVRDPFEFNQFRLSQAAQITTPTVLVAALRDQRVSQQPLLKEQEDPIKFLQDNLQVTFPGDSELMRIAMTSEAPEQAEVIVNAVLEQYMDKVANRIRNERAVRIQNLEKALRDANAELTDKFSEYRRLQETIGALDAEQATAQLRLVQDELRQLSRDESELKKQLFNTQMEIEEAKIELDWMENNPVSEMMVENHLAGMPQFAATFSSLFDARNKLRDLQGRYAGSENPQIARLRQQVETLEAQADEIKAEFGPQIQAQLGGTPEALELLIQRKQAELENSQQTLEEVNSKITESSEDVIRLTARSTDLERLRSEVDVLKANKERVFEVLNSLRMEAEAPERVTLMDKARVPLGRDETMKMIVVGFAGFMGFCLAVTGVAFFEFASRRISTPADLTDGLRLNVVGALPPLSGSFQRRLRGPGNNGTAIMGLLSESVDGVRTMLMHSATVNDTRVVMVTSPSEREGKTTLASQLATSLARAGRRVLIMDADVRRPTQHQLFEQPLTPGLSEVLRDEVALDDVIRPTPANGLWMITAGACDAEAVQALAKDGLKEAFASLRPDFDFIVVDAGPVLGMADTLLIGQHSDAALLSVLRDVSQAPKIYEAQQRLASVGVNLLGAVMQGVRSYTPGRVHEHLSN
ncbi:MAG: polysaccharide biosynthesis tyrosine autokinase [Pirellulales bacterium]